MARPVAPAGFFLALSIAGCTIAESTFVDPRFPPPPGIVSCASDLGSYALPRAYVQVVVGQRVVAEPPALVFPDAADVRFEVVRRPDPTLTACLDYLSSAFAHDQIKVNKADRPPIDPTVKGGAGDPRQPAVRPLQGGAFLQSIVVNAEDRTAQIVRTLVRAFFVLASGDPNFRSAALTFADKPQILAEYDPFDPVESARVNARLSQLGVCLLLEDFTFDKHTLSVDQYCNAPMKGVVHPSRGAERYVEVAAQPVSPTIQGVLYRPRQSYRLMVYRKRDRGGREPWTLERMSTVELENLSPVIAMGISRAVFARRRALLIFKEGTLLTACVAKASEVEGFVTIPFEIARSLVALPASIIQAKIDTTAKSTELIQTERLLLQVQKAHMAALQNGTYQSPSGVPKFAPKPIELPTDTGLAPLPADVAPLDVDFAGTGIATAIQQICKDPAI